MHALAVSSEVEKFVGGTRWGGLVEENQVLSEILPLGLGSGGVFLVDGMDVVYQAIFLEGLRRSSVSGRELGLVNEHNQNLRRL